MTGIGEWLFARLVRRSLLFAAMMIAFLVPSAIASPVLDPVLTCGASAPFFNFDPDDSAAFACQTVAKQYSPLITSQKFEFDQYGAGLFAFTNQLTFDEVLSDFTLFMTAYFVEVGNPDFLSRIPSGFVPETFATTFGPAWVFFYIENLQAPDCDTDCQEPQLGSEYGPDGSDDDANAWTQQIIWFGDGDFNDPQVLHNPRGGANFFGNVITQPGSFNEDINPCNFSNASDCGPPACCIDFTDPVIVGSADDFSATIPVSKVPEPSSLVLVGIGTVGVVVRRLRRRARPAQDPRWTS